MIRKLLPDEWRKPTCRRQWDIQLASNWWLSVGVHIDHTDPSITLHLPGLIIYAGRCVYPGLAGWSAREGRTRIERVYDHEER